MKTLHRTPMVDPIKGLRPQSLAALILGCFVALGIIYSLVNPLFESPDEIYHYPYVKYVADGYGLPVQDPTGAALWEQEGSQPPLYYLLSAALTCWIDTDDLPAVRRLNPHARIGIPLALDNKNMVIHTAQEAPPWRGTVLAVHLIRLLSLVLGAGTVWCTYRIATHLLPDQPALALGAMALNAFNPMFLLISASVNNDNLVVFLASLTLLLLVRLLQEGFSRRGLVLLGVVIGLACLSKLSALALIPLAVLALALRHLLGDAAGMLDLTSLGQRLALRPRRLRRSEVRREGGVGTRSTRPALLPGMRRWLVDSLIVLLPVALIAGWWYGRNVLLYGDPLGLKIMLDIFGRREAMPSGYSLLGEFRGFRFSFWGIMGIMNVLLRPRMVYTLLDLLTIIALVGLGWRTIRAWRSRQGGAWPILLLLATWIVLVSVALIRWTLMTMASQGRLIFPAISAIVLFFALGLTAWAPKPGLVTGPLALLMFLLAATVPWTTIRPAYARPPILRTADIPASAQPFMATYGGVMRLLAYQIDRSEVRPGESLFVTLYWQALAPMEQDYSIYIHVFGRDDKRLGQRDTYPGNGAYPTSLWSPGQIIRDTFEVPIDPAAEGPVAARVEVGLYDWQDMTRLIVVDGRGQEVGQPIVGRVKIVAPTAPVAPAQAIQADLGHRVQLIGYDLDEGQFRPGAEVPITLYWQVTDRLDRDYNVFVHLLDERENRVGQGDGPPQDNVYPTSLWAPGETLADTHRLTLPPDWAPGAYRLFVGLYDLASGERVPVLDSAGQPIGDRVLLRTIERLTP